MNNSRLGVLDSIMVLRVKRPDTLLLPLDTALLQDSAESTEMIDDDAATHATMLKHARITSCRDDVNLVGKLTQPQSNWSKVCVCAALPC